MKFSIYFFNYISISNTDYNFLQLRIQSYDKFISSNTRVMVCTDIASRGLDCNDVRYFLLLLFMLFNTLFKKTLTTMKFLLFYIFRSHLL